MTLLQTLFGFQGRIGRAVFWLCILAICLLDAAVLLLTLDWGAPDVVSATTATVLVAAFVLSAWAGLALKVKRLHDRGRSGLYLLAVLLPVAGWLWLASEIGFAPGRRSGARFDARRETRRLPPGSGHA